MRLPTGIFYKQGVKANVLFFDKKRVSAEPNTKDLWIYDLRTNQRFTLKERPMTRADLDDFVACYKSGRRHERAETERFRRFAHAELIARDKINLDIFWLKDDTLDDPDLLPPPDEIAAEIVENLEAALDRFEGRAEPAAGGLMKALVPPASGVPREIVLKLHFLIGKFRLICYYLIDADLVIPTAPPRSLASHGVGTSRSLLFSHNKINSRTAPAPAVLSL